MNGKELSAMGIPRDSLPAAYRALAAASAAKVDAQEMRDKIGEVVLMPSAFVNDSVYGELAVSLENAEAPFLERAVPAHFRVWGDGFQPETLKQMQEACRLPVSAFGALMPDGHPGFGIPIGGILAARNAVIPYGVGNDIACRMRLSVFDIQASDYPSRIDDFERALRQETRFGKGGVFDRPREHVVMDEDWTATKFLAGLKDLAFRQLGTSGSGNHHADIGIIRIAAETHGLPAGEYVALLTHSGSRAPGGKVAAYYTDVATGRCKNLPQDLKRLAWLELDSDAGQEYWCAMEMMGRYAAANHHLMHQHIAVNLGAEVLATVENHHNFAWREEHFGEEVVVHRKGATPASKGTIGIIPGSMATPAYVVAGNGNPHSLNSASHGAGRAMSRSEAKARYSKTAMGDYLAEKGVVLLAGGVDECPMAYKDINEVMAAQADLVETLGVFEPRMVMMDKAEDDE